MSKWQELVEDKDLLLTLHSQGMTCEQLAEKWDTSRTMVYRLLAVFGKRRNLYNYPAYDSGNAYAGMVRSREEKTPVIITHIRTPSVVVLPVQLFEELTGLTIEITEVINDKDS